MSMSTYLKKCISHFSNILIFSLSCFTLNAILHKLSAATAPVPVMHQIWREAHKIPAAHEQAQITAVAWRAKTHEATDAILSAVIRN